DVIVKRKRYDHFGVSEYWIVDPAIDAIEILRRGAGGFERAAELGLETGGRIESPLLPGFSLAVAELFRD
ncbi:MAG TPA: Uma2 family endonuclease, partial [Thermoanaerobaculia bacterium]|nr:Uma2 family endonuclease [Thermoanaerobaculia bacterium]